MIAEYHLTGTSWGSSSLSPVLPEVAEELLPPVEDYIAGGDFQGTRDVRVMERVKTLRIATWLHRLDMVADGDGIVSQTMEVAWHGRGSLLELLLGPMTGSLTFAEVVDHVMTKNRHRAECSLIDVRGCCAQIRGELDDLVEARRTEMDKTSQKRIKKEMDLRRKDLKSLNTAISHHESNLGMVRDQPEETAIIDNDSSHHGAGDPVEAEMATAPAVDDAPSGGATTQPSDPPPGEEQTGSMEVDDENGGPPPASPISPGEDDLLTGHGAAGVEGEMANLTVSSPRGPDGGGEDASI